MIHPQDSLQPAPAELEGPLRNEADVLRHRRLDCPHYDGCLDASIRRDWQGFTCLHCPVGAALEAEEHQRRERLPAARPPSPRPMLKRGDRP